MSQTVSKDSFGARADLRVGEASYEIFKLAAVGTIPFAIVKDRMGTPASLLVLACFILAGLLLTLLINENRGRQAAQAADCTSPSLQAD